ncbi:hypothetical protein R1sor_016548 [Riccia sorocarpa]|uniref:Uncharacterized protein n=1 Tax=Riccia sorocarpa TaxID=122646 RepID=A0ABD3HIJ3_9MARC
MAFKHMHVLHLMLLLAVVTADAATIFTYNVQSCDGSPTNEFRVGDNVCQTFNDQSAISVRDIDSNTHADAAHVTEAVTVTP